jgi:glycosyltransferase involved in cell wall biosynthesis
MSEVAGDAALLARAGDAQQLAELLTTALDMNDEERALRARLARARAEIFTWDSSIAQHVRAYEMAARR